MHWAIHSNRIDIVSFLLIKGANPSILTIDQYTPLQLSVLHHSYDILDMLLNQHLVDINQVTSHGTAVHVGVRSEDIKSIEMLLKYEASIDIVDSNNKLPIDICNNK